MHADNSVSDQIIKKQEELYELGEKINQQQKIIFSLRNEYEAYRDDIVSQNANKSNVDNLKDLLDKALEDLWLKFRGQVSETFYSMNFDHETLNLSKLQASLLKYHYIRTAYAINLLYLLLIKWDDCAREINQLTNS